MTQSPQFALDPSRDPWEQQPGEDIYWFNRFNKYAKTMGVDFTPRRAFRLWFEDQIRENKKPDPAEYPLWVTAAEKYEWTSRSVAYASEDQKMLEILWRSRRLQLLEDDWRDSASLRGVARDFLDALPLHKEVQTMEVDGVQQVMLALNITPGQLATLMKTASELARLSVNEPTVIAQAKGPNDKVGLYLPTLTDLSEPDPVPQSAVPGLPEPIEPPDSNE